MLHGGITNEKDGPFAETDFNDTQMKELEYAALLHDFGKVYIDPSVFMKSKKLFPQDMANLQLKLDYLYRTIELEYVQKENSIFSTNEPENARKLVAEMNVKRQETLAIIRETKEQVNATQRTDDN